MCVIDAYIDYNAWLVTKPQNMSEKCVQALRTIGSNPACMAFDRCSTPGRLTPSLEFADLLHGSATPTVSDTCITGCVRPFNNKATKMPLAAVPVLGQQSQSQYHSAG